MYALYSLLTAAGMLLLSPYFLRARVDPGKIPQQHPGTPRMEVSARVARWKLARVDGKIDLDSCGIRRRSSCRASTCAAAEKKIPAAPPRRFHHHGHGPENRARTDAVCGRDFLLSAGLARPCPAGSRCRASGSGDHRGDRDLAQFSARVPPRGRAGDFREWPAVGAVLPRLWPRAFVFRGSSLRDF